MARIDSRHGKFRARVSTPTGDITHTFHDKKTAELWCKYKESLINEMKAFDVDPKEYVTFYDAIELKIRKAVQDNLEPRSIQDLKELHKVFEEFKDRDVLSVTYDELVVFSRKFLQTPTQKGGKRENRTGIQILPTISTLISKIRRLSGVYSNLIENGIPVENIAIKIGAWLNAEKEKTNQCEQ